MKNYHPVPKNPKKRCPYCRVLFDPPARKRGLEIRFCCAEHRKAYHKMGALPFSKFTDQITKSLVRAVQDLTTHNEKSLVSIEDRARTFIKNELDKVWSEVLKLSKDCARTWEIEPPEEQTASIERLGERIAKVERDVLVLKTNAAFEHWPSGPRLKE